MDVMHVPWNRYLSVLLLLFDDVIFQKAFIIQDLFWEKICLNIHTIFRYDTHLGAAQYNSCLSANSARLPKQ